MRPPGTPSSLSAVRNAIISCEQCPRLRSYCQEVGRTRKAAFATMLYWARPVPGFGDPARARVDSRPGPCRAWREPDGARLYRRRRRRVWRFPDGRVEARRLREHRHLATRRRWAGVDGCLYRGGGALRPAGQQAAARGSQSLPRPSRERSRAPAQPASRRRARQDRVGCVAEALARAARRCRGHGRRSATVRRGLHQTASAPCTLVGAYHPSRQNTNTGVVTAKMYDAVFGP